MAEAFLYDLLQMHNSVYIEDERCSICLEEYGTLSRETGTMEVEMRLPCNHTVGSACIAVWLKDNNSCPMCRREFFPAQPRPYLEHGIMDGQADEDFEDQGDQPDIGELNDDCCAQLELDLDVSMIASVIARRITETERWSAGHTKRCVVAVSIYMASYLTGELRSPRLVGAVAGVDADHIRFTYDLIYPEREHVADADLLDVLEDTFGEMPPLNWPAPGNEFTDEQIEGRHVSRLLRQCCAEGCNELGLDDEIADLSNSIAETLYADGDMGRVSPRLIAAVGIFLASHAARRPVTSRRVAEAVGMSASAFRSAYRAARANGSVQVAWDDGLVREYLESGFGHLSLGLETDSGRLPSP